MQISEEVHQVWGSAGLTEREGSNPSVPDSTGTSVKPESNVP